MARGVTAGPEVSVTVTITMSVMVTKLPLGGSDVGAGPGRCERVGILVGAGWVELRKGAPLEIEGTTGGDGARGGGEEAPPVGAGVLAGTDGLTGLGAPVGAGVPEGEPEGEPEKMGPTSPLTTSVIRAVRLL